MLGPSMPLQFHYELKFSLGCRIDQRKCKNLNANSNDILETDCHQVCNGLSFPHCFRFFYSLFSMVFQYMLPILIVSVAYASICRKLRDRMVAKGSQLEEKLLRERQRVQRTNKLLISITIIFILSWLPLNVLNAYVDYMGSKMDNSFRQVLQARWRSTRKTLCGRRREGEEENLFDLHRYLNIDKKHT